MRSLPTSFLRYLTTSSQLQRLRNVETHTRLVMSGASEEMYKTTYSMILSKKHHRISQKTFNSGIWISDLRRRAMNFASSQNYQAHKTGLKCNRDLKLSLNIKGAVIETYTPKEMRTHSHHTFTLLGGYGARGVTDLTFRTQVIWLFAFTSLTSALAASTASREGWGQAT
jgi:hypothetical protein